jgi:hypothetical protein
VLRIGYQTGNDVGIQSLIPLVATAHSVRDPGQVLHAGIDAAFTALPRADLQVPSIFLSDSGHRASGGSEDFHGSVGVPIAITAEMVNHGLETAGGADQPIAVRLEVQQAPGGQPTGAPVLVRSVAQTAAMRGCTPACPPSQFLTLGEWTPPSEGLYRVRVVVNDPAAGEGAPIPENDFGNDASVRFVQVGAVPLPEVRVTQGWLIPLREGSCDLGAAPVQVAVAGHAYCSVAHVANQGGAPALNVRVDFRVGGALFSSRFPFAAGDGSFPSGSALDVVSSPWVARLRTDGGQDWTFGVEVSSASSSQTPLGKSVQFPVRVDQYRLALAQGTAPAVVLLAPGGEAVVEFNVTNVGTAVATPRVADSGVDVPVSVHVLQATPLLPPQDGRAGETGRVRIVLDAARAFNATDVVPPIHLTTQEDSLVSLALPLDVRAAGPLLARAATLPLTTLPGNVTAQVVLDNTATGLPTDWTLQGADWPLAADGQALGEVAPFATAVRAVALRVAEAPPGAYDVNLTLQARQGPAAQAFQVPIHLVVLPDLRMDASLPSSFIAGRAGQPVGLVVHVANPGNLPIEARVNATVQPGTVAAPGPAALAPGASADLALLVRQGGSSRSIGSAAVEWRTPGGPWRSGPAFPWQVDFAPAAIRIASSNLDGLSTKGGKVGEVQATLRNDADGPVQAELLVVVDGVLEGRATVSLEPGQSRPVTVAFQAGPAGVSQVVELVARPVGSTLGAGDPLLYQVGDAQARNLVPAQDGFLGIPAPAMALAALLLLALAGLARRKAA